MRIKAIELSWFRGAADPVSLEPDCKSMVVYGANGSGKSSFVDAVEHILSDGKIGHLSHEYSGRRQEKAVLNTHKPNNRKAELSIKFKDDSHLKTEISEDGNFTRSGAEEIAMNKWDYRRTVLRQHEVGAFIHDTKGDKYSALLPLLGLHEMEIAAENLRQLAKTVQKQSKLNALKGKLREVQIAREATFGKDSDDQILEKIWELHAKYCPDKSDTEDTLSCCEELKLAIDDRINQSSADQRRQIILQDVGSLGLKDHVEAVRDANGNLAGAVEPLIKEKLEILQSTGTFIDKVEDERNVRCPACGRSITVDAFKEHVKAEKERLSEINGVFQARKADIAILCHTVQSLKSNLSKDDVKSWRKLQVEPFTAYLELADNMNIEMLRTSCGAEDLKLIEDNLQPIVDAAAAAAKVIPEAAQLSTDRSTASDGNTVLVSTEQAAEIDRMEDLIAFLNDLELSVREEIKVRSEKVIQDISIDIQSMWSILHPNQKIKDVFLYVPKNVDKAIDISLKFYNVDQESPRLTLSEGYRNSLGLCIFLAMAKQRAGTDRPLFLDDVVVSLDRNHRGMVANLLENQFSDRQVVIFTHDREWYTDLCLQLDGRRWSFKTLLPYKAPDIGIRWSHKTTTFDDARAHLDDRPDSAGNDARKIMDVELARIAERCQIRLPFMRGDRNDKRTAHEFLQRFVADAKKCFQKKVGETYEIREDAIAAFRKADRLLVSWGNRGSHNFNLETCEATQLLNSSEKALEYFKCHTCGKSVGVANSAGSKSVQCQCGQVRWRYGKG